MAEPIAKAAKTPGAPAPAPPGRSEMPAPPGRRLMAEAPPLMANRTVLVKVNENPAAGANLSSADLARPINPSLF